MSATSPNGWAVSPNPEDINITPMQVGVGDSAVFFSPGVRGGRVHQVLSYVANAVHTRIQHASQVHGCYGYSFRENVNSPGVWSNHASGTAIDFNATRNPNGVPTAECFTPAQIAEIHAILDEVGGAVRWGGDYSGVPDSMHFEIDVTPGQLESMELPDVTSSFTIGSPDWEEATELTSMSVSYPTMAAYAPYAYWKFTATETGRISMDALLSHYVDDALNIEATGGPSVQLAVWRLVGNSWLDGTSGSYYSVITQPGFPAYSTTYRNQGRLIINAVAGQTYLIRTYADAAYPYIRTVVRIGDYAEQPPWIQPPDQLRIWAFTDGSFGTDVTHLSTNGVISEPGNYSGFRGGETKFTRGFGQPTPGTILEAIECNWRWARRLYANSLLFWGGDGYAGTCQNWSGLIDIASQWAGGVVGHTYTSDEYNLGFFYHQEICFRTYAISVIFTPAAITPYEKRNGQAKQFDTQATYLPAILSTEILEWESTVSTLVDVDYAWDERAGSDANAHPGMTVKWYKGDAAQPRNVGEWGPNPIDAGGIWYGQGSDTPENWAGSQEHLGDTVGGSTTWRQLDTANWDGTIEETRFTALPRDLLFDTLPDYGGQSIVGNELYRRNYRTGCYMAIRSTVRPSRYRIFPDPGIPDIDWAGVNAIAIELDESSPVLY